MSKQKETSPVRQSRCRSDRDLSRATFPLRLKRIATNRMNFHRPKSVHHNRLVRLKITGLKTAADPSFSNKITEIIKNQVEQQEWVNTKNHKTSNFDVPLYSCSEIYTPDRCGNRFRKFVVKRNREELFKNSSSCSVIIHGFSQISLHSYLHNVKRQASSKIASLTSRVEPLAILEKVYPPALFQVFICFKFIALRLKIETKFVWAKWRVKENETLLWEAHWPPLAILSWWHQQKTEKCTSIDCCGKFPLGVSNPSLYKFSDFLEKKVCHLFLADHIYISASKPFLHTACFTHNQMLSFGRR